MKFKLFSIIMLSIFAGNQARAYDSAVAYQSWYVLHQMEKQASIPKGLLMAMSLVETGQALEGSILPWPYTINVNSSTLPLTSGRIAQKESTLRKTQARSFSLKGLDVSKVSLSDLIIAVKALPSDTKVELVIHSYSKRFKEKYQAVNAAKSLLRIGHNNFDAGLLQINWKYHGENFESIEQAFEPSANVEYAVSYLRKHRQERDWWRSVGRYHSGTDKHAQRYIDNVWSMYQKVHRLPSI